MSADPHVQAPDDLQSWNRYSYVLNNPLSFTDPTGYFFKKLFGKGGVLGKLFRQIGKVLKQILKFVIQLVACGTGIAIICAAGSAIGTLIAGGSVKDALKAFAFAFVSAGIFERVGTFLQPFAGTAGFALLKMGIHGIVGGALAVAQGGRFLQGFAGSAFGALGGLMTEGVMGGPGHPDFAGKLVRSLIAAAAGCAGAAVTGGKCAEGALTAAIAHLYNQEVSAEASRHAAFREAKHAAGITDQTSFKVVHEKLYDEDKRGKVWVRDAAGNIVTGRTYVYDTPTGQVRIQEYSIGHYKNGKLVETGHFNVRDASGATLVGTKEHYYFKYAVYPANIVKHYWARFGGGMRARGSD